MGYARLAFPNAGTIASTAVLYDIVGCVTGRFSSSAQLTTALTGSEIVNTLGQNWNFTYPSASAFTGANVSSASGSWVLTAPCVNSSKIKYVRLATVYNPSSTVIIAPSGSSAQNTYGYLGNPGGIMLQACTSASSAFTLINPSWYHTDTTAGLTGRSSMFTGTTIIVSWSSRHLIIWSNYTGGTGGASNPFSLMGTIEFPENDVTIAQTTTPSVVIIERSGNLSSSISSYTTTNPGTTAYGDIQFPDFYDVTTFTRASVSHGLLATVFDGLNHQWNKPVNTTPTITSTGINITPLLPLSIHLMSRGFPYAHLSALSNVYITATGLGNGGDIIRVGSDDYAYLPSNTGMSFAVKKV